MLQVLGTRLIAADKVFRCAIGKGGFSTDKREGDGCTPVGVFPLRECWYRADRIAAPVTGLPLKIIRENDGWCDDAGSGEYNRHIVLTVPPAGGGDKGGTPPRKEWKIGEGPHSTRHPEALRNAKELRRNLTKAERKLWYEVLASKQLENLKFRKQMPVGPYIADFACVEKKLIIELDGGQHREEEGEVRDAKRTVFLENTGYRVLRFWNSDVLNNLEGVVETIRAALVNTHPPLPPPLAGGASFEHLWREDHVYDLIIPIGYNDDPVIPGRGSAIFMHLAKADYSPTEGCVALAREDLLAILPELSPETCIEIRQG